MSKGKESRIKRWLKSRKFWKRFALIFLGVPILLFAILVLVVYVKQDSIVQELIGDLNKDFTGHIEIEDSHVSLFENFPYISIDLENVKVHETKADEGVTLVDIADIYAGFDLWTIISGKMEIRKIKLVDGSINLVQHEDGEFNIVKALSSPSEEEAVEDVEEEFHLDLKKIELENIELTKLNEANQLLVEAFIEEADSKFETSPDHILATLDTKFELNIINNGDTTYIKRKHIDFDTHVDYLKGEDKLTIEPTKLHLEGAEFDLDGDIDFRNDVDLNLAFTGKKKNFDLFIAMAPQDLIPTLREYENAGDIYFNTTIKGKSINGHNPLIDANFGCKNGYIINPKTDKKVSGLNFDGHFSNGDKRSPETMEFSIKNFTAKPAAGNIKFDIAANNFTAPDVMLDLHTKFDMQFIAKFLDFKHLRDFKGKVGVDIDFRDIIDLENPEHAIEKLNEHYNMKISLENLSFDSDYYDLPLKKLNFLTEINGHKAEIKKCKAQVGKSDISISGVIDDLPAIIHHTDIPVDTRLKISSKYLDIHELTGGDSTGFDEQIENLKLDLDFKASAKSFTESKYLPVGEFFIENFYAKMKHYPHTLHDFHADIFIDEQDLRVVDFKGMIDKSDFLFTGKLEHYEKWFDEHPGGDSKIEFNLNSKMMQLESLFSYKGENYVPEDYRHEELDDLKIHGFTYLHYADELKSIDLNLDKFQAKMKIHPLKFENFKGRVHYEDEHLVVEDFHGKLGQSVFQTTLHYYLGDNEAVKKRDNHFALKASRLDIDQLINYNPLPPSKSKPGEAPKQVDHDAGFNIYTVPFTDMTFDLDVNHFTYHKMNLKNVKGKLRTTPDHYIHLEDLGLNAAGGSFKLNGYFNGSNPDLIYFSPDIQATNVDLDQLLFKFDNFGQDHVVAENLHGRFTGKITGKVHMHTDLVPKIDDSEIHLDANIVNGRLENYTLLDYMDDYFKDKNLKKVIFDTLNNHIDMTNGVMTIPTMAINSSLGHIEISGKQHTDGKMEYYLKIPWKMITGAAKSRLFGGKKEEEIPEDQIDEIQYADEKTKYVNIKIVGDYEDYKISIGKPKKKKDKNS